MTAHVDAHLHVWDLDRCHYGWLSPAAGALHRTFTAGEAHKALQAAGMDAAVLVQAADTICDTDAMLDAAAAHPWVAGVVGWVPLADPAAAARELDRRTAAWPVFKGVRHLVHVDPDREFLARPEVVTSLRTVARHGLVLDVPDAWPRHLPAMAALADAVPDLTVVLDHLGKPPIGRDDFPAWAAALRDLARRGNVVAKLSGLDTATRRRDWTAHDLRPAVDLALESFGPSRLMYGGDWPMTVPGGGYASVWSRMRESVAALSLDERRAVMGGTATRVYGLDLAGPGPAMG